MEFFCNGSRGTTPEICPATATPRGCVDRAMILDLMRGIYEPKHETKDFHALPAKQKQKYSGAGTRQVDEQEALLPSAMAAYVTVVTPGPLESGRLHVLHGHSGRAGQEHGLRHSPNTYHSTFGRTPGIAPSRRQTIVTPPRST